MKQAESNNEMGSLCSILNLTSRSLGLHQLFKMYLGANDGILCNERERDAEKEQTLDTNS